MHHDSPLHRWCHCKWRPASFDNLLLLHQGVNCQQGVRQSSADVAIPPPRVRPRPRIVGGVPPPPTKVASGPKQIPWHLRVLIGEDIQCLLDPPLRPPEVVQVIPEARALPVAAVVASPRCLRLQLLQGDVTCVLVTPSAIVGSCRIVAPPLQRQSIPDPARSRSIVVRVWIFVNELVAADHIAVLAVGVVAIGLASAFVAGEATTSAHALVVGEPWPEVHAFREELL
mmetsp:Transcript_6012/g.14661  ORF Transcript_6012/g.14661 Transcript_6012/m.14661 type:complete len:228 (-) Transcript_6012:260-943(-)